VRELLINPGSNIHSVPHTDTSPAAQAVQFEILRAMSGEQRLLLAFEMSLFARELARRGSGANIPSGPKHASRENCCGWHFFRCPSPPGFHLSRE
jgi:hypothetical protein